jgi:hypothetical protein
MANIEVTSLVSQRDKQPYVQVSVNDGKQTAKIQLTPEDAREQANILQHAAEAAFSDAFLLTFVRDTLKVTDEIVLGKILLSWRDYREKREWEARTLKVKQ